MLTPNFTIDNSSINAVKARVSIYDGSSIFGGTLVHTCTCSDYLQNFSVSRVGESGKFFGFGICQQLKLQLIDLEKELTITKGMAIGVEYGDGTNFISPHPLFFAEEIVRNEENNTIDITAYDALYKASSIKLADVEIVDNFVTPYNPKEPSTLLATCASALGLTTLYGVLNIPNEIIYDNEPNFDGTETIADVLRTIAETAQAFYYINRTVLTIKRLDFANDPALTITKDDYLSLKVGENVTLEGIHHITELGENIYAGAAEGTVQYVRENAYWENNTDNIASHLETAWANMNGISINQFTCENWIGNFLLEIGDKIAFETEDGSTIIAYLLDDVISFDGTLSQTTRWAYEMSDEEVASNPTSLGEAIKQTYARVDKANKQITLLASETDTTKDRVSNLEVSTNGISATVSEVKKSTEEAIGAINENFETLSQQVNMKMSAEDVQITVETEMKKGVDKVTTSTGFTFNEEGLTVSKSGSEMTTQITEDGMTISRSGQETLVADNTGVRAENLHATTYLIIGNTSRFEDWGDRTGCFWIGG